MKYKVNVVPFEDYYINCYYNALLSILTYYEDSYRIASYINSYVPVFAPSESSYFPYVGIKDSFKETFESCFRVEKFNFVQKEDCLEVVEEALKKNQYIVVFVDLFYWDNTGTIYGKSHLSHPSLIVGYDKENAKIYAIEDELGSIIKYYVHEYKAEDFIKAVMSKGQDLVNQQDCDYKIYHLIQPLQPYELIREEVISNCKKSIETLEQNYIKNFQVDANIMAESGLMDEYIRSHTRYANRQIANRLLIQYLQKCMYLTIPQVESLDETIEAIIEQIDNSKMIILRSTLTKKLVDDVAITDCWRKVFSLEKQLWEEMLQGLESVKM